MFYDDCVISLKFNYYFIIVKYVKDKLESIYIWERWKWLDYDR